jgi:hypothetical protein
MTPPAGESQQFAWDFFIAHSSTWAIFEGVIVPARIREIRRLALEVIRLPVAGALGSEFAHHELEYLDM